MAISLVHAFESGKSDGPDATKVQPSNWNDEHELTMATARILGRKTASTGAVEELTADDVYDLLGIIGGTKQLFVQTNAPTGWTKDTDQNDKALRIVSGAASSGGTSPFSTVFGKTATDGYTLLTADIPAHAHGAGSFAVGTAINNATAVVRASGFPDVDTSGNDAASGLNTATASTLALTSGAVSGTSAEAGGAGPHAHAMDIRVQYVDVIKATKD